MPRPRSLARFPHRCLRSARKMNLVNSHHLLFTTTSIHTLIPAAPLQLRHNPLSVPDIFFLGPLEGHSPSQNHSPLQTLHNSVRQQHIEHISQQQLNVHLPYGTTSMRNTWRRSYNRRMALVTHTTKVLPNAVTSPSIPCVVQSLSLAKHL